MNYLINFFARKGQFSDLVTFFILFVGIVAAVTIQREVFPNISYDIVTVTTIYPGASPDECEKFITNPLEQDLLEVEGIKKMKSVSAESRSFILLQVDPDVATGEEIKADVQDVVERFKQDLPEDAEDPVVATIDSNIIPIIEVALFGDVDEEELRDVAKVVEKDLRKINEVARVDFSGLRDFEIKVKADPYKLRNFQLSVDEMILALKRQNISIPGGIVTPNKTGLEVAIRTIGEFQTLEDVENTVIRANSLGRAIQVKDVASVSMGFKEASLIYRANGKRGVGITVSKKENADAVDLVAKVRKAVRTRLLDYDGRIKLTFLNDFSYYIKRRLSVLSNNLLIGLILVLAILSLVLPLRVALVTSIGIPFSFLGTLLYFQIHEISLNLITMMGLIIVIGMLVDDAIVVCENAQRKFEEGLDALSAAVVGTQEVWAPVTASVLTTIMAFAPMLFMSGIFGKFISFIPLGVIIALCFSLYECFFILPHHFAQWGVSKKHKAGKTASGEAMQEAPLSKAWETYVVPGYASAVEKLIKLRYLVLVGVIIAFSGSMYLAFNKMKFILFPAEGIEAFMVHVTTPYGTPLETTAEVLKPIEREVAKLPKLYMNDFATKAGLQQSSADDPNTKRGGEYGQVFVYLTPATEREESAKDVMNSIKEQVGEIQGARKVIYQLVRGGPPVGKPVSVGVQGKEYEDVLAAVEALRAIVEKIPGVSDIESSYIQGKEEIWLQIDQAEAAAAGLSAQQIGTAIRASYEGVEATSIQKLDEEIDIRVQLAGVDSEDPSEIAKVKVANALGNLVPVGQVTTMKTGQGIAVYEHEANERQVRITAELDTDLSSATEAAAFIEERLPELEKAHPKVTFGFGGEEEDTNESMASLKRAFTIAVLGIYLIMVLIMGSYLRPFLVISVIPLGLIGVILAFYIHDKPITFLAMVGVVALSGVIVNNGIVFVDFVNRQRDLGEDRFQSLLSAARMRIRPIFLTTVTTSAGILPTAYGWGGLDPFVVPIALSLGYGVLFGSVFTVFVFPAAFAIMDDFLVMLGFMKKTS